MNKVDVAHMLSRQVGYTVEPSIESIFHCFEDKCKVSGYGQCIWDDRYISAFEIAQDFLIKVGKISSRNCMRT